MAFPTQSDQIIKGIPPFLTNRQARCPTGKDRGQTTGHLMGRRGNSPCGQRVDCFQTAPNPVHCKTQRMGQPGIIYQKVQHVFFPDLGTVQLTISFKSVAGPQQADPVAFSLGRILS